MNATAPIFLMGIGIGTGLLVIGLLLGAWIGRRSQVIPPANPMGMDPQQFLLFLQNLSRWTNEVSVDVSKYQTKLNHLSQHVEAGAAGGSKEEVQSLLKQIMDANHQLQSRLDSAEVRLENQTKEIASYLTEARTDGLTGLANRRAFDQELDEQHRKSVPLKKSFSLAIIDIDHFKKINDTYGHPAGDAVLREIASRLRLQLPQAIQVARYGGEEFAILLDQPLDQAAQTMDQVRLAISGQLVEAEGQQLRVTMSCGVAESQVEERIGKLVRRSDEALYAAKQGGRNRVYVHDGRLCHVVGNPGPALATAGSHDTAATSGNAESTNPDQVLLERLQKRLVKIVEEEVRGGR